MTTSTRHALLRLGTLAAALGAAALLSGCVVEGPVRYVDRPVPVYPRQPAPEYAAPSPSYVDEDDPVVSVYVDPPLEQPEPIAVDWAPPPMLVEVPPPQPYGEAVWTGGYWAWEGRWFWSAGRWAPPPRPSYTWVQPYYEHRADVVVFVPGFWCPPQRRFVPPPPGLRISRAIAAPGIRFGRPPMGPQGVFVPPPPGSRAGLIVPAPLGTSPAVVVGAPPVVNVGMRVRGDGDGRGAPRRGGDMTVEAPAGSTANGQAFQNSVPARGPLPGQMGGAVGPSAPRPTSSQSIPAYQAGHQPMQLPAGQPVRGGGRPQQAQQPGGQPLQGQPSAPQGPGPSRPVPGAGPGQRRPEFDPPPRQPAPVDGQAPQGRPPGQPQAQPGQPMRPPGQEGGRLPPGQPQPQTQPQARQPARQPSQQPPAGNAQDPRRGGGNPPGRQAPQPAPPVAPPAPQTQDDHSKEAKEPRARPERETPGDRDKRNGERDR
jgi:hypothetical protein